MCVLENERPKFAPREDERAKVIGRHAKQAA